MKIHLSRSEKAILPPIKVAKPYQNSLINQKILKIPYFPPLKQKSIFHSCMRTPIQLIGESFNFCEFSSDSPRLKKHRLINFNDKKLKFQRKLRNYPYFPRKTPKEIFIEQSFREKNDLDLTLDLTEKKNDKNENNNLKIKENNEYIRKIIYRNMLNNFKNQNFDPSNEILFVKTLKYLSKSTEKFKNNSISIDTIKNNYKKNVCVHVLKKNISFFKHNPPEITDRILLTLGINPLNDFELINQVKLKRIKSILGNNQEYSNEIMDFIIKFINLEDNYQLKIEDLKCLIRLLVRKMTEKGDLYERIIENMDISNKENVDQDYLKQIFVENKIEKEQFLNLIVCEFV